MVRVLFVTSKLAMCARTRSLASADTLVDNLRTAARQRCSCAVALRWIAAADVRDVDNDNDDDEDDDDDDDDDESRRGSSFDAVGAVSSSVAACERRVW